MEVEISGDEVLCVIFEEELENGERESEDCVNIYWKDGTKTKCMVLEEL
jgi:hypothetical protein